MNGRQLTPTPARRQRYFRSTATTQRAAAIDKAKRVELEKAEAWQPEAEVPPGGLSDEEGEGGREEGDEAEEQEQEQEEGTHGADDDDNVRLATRTSPTLAPSPLPAVWDAEAARKRLSRTRPQHVQHARVQTQPALLHRNAVSLSRTTGLASTPMTTPSSSSSSSSHASTPSSAASRRAQRATELRKKRARTHSFGQWSARGGSNKEQRSSEQGE